MIYLKIISIILIIFSILLIFKPSWIFIANRWGNKIIFTDSEFFSSSKISGLLFIVMGIFFIYLSFYLDKLEIVLTIMRQ